MLLPEKNNFEITPQGTFVATCYRLIDLGTQIEQFKGETKKMHKIMISWELPSELMNDGKPFSIHKKYTLSSSNKAILRKDLESWRGQPFDDADFGKFDISVLLGKQCFIGIVHAVVGDNTYANISTLVKLPKDYPVPAQINPSVYFSLEAFDQTVYDGLSENMRATIAKSPEYQSLKGADKTDPNTSNAHEEDYSSSVPF